MAKQDFFLFGEKERKIMDGWVDVWMYGWIIGGVCLCVSVCFVGDQT